MATESESGSAQTTTDHDEIRRWVEARNGHPACVRGTESGDTCLLRIDYPGYSGGETLEEISWDEFFRVFDESNVAFLYQDRTADGGESRFSKFVSRGGSGGGGRSSGGRSGGARSAARSGGSARSGGGSRSGGSSRKSSGGSGGRGGSAQKSAARKGGK